MGGILIDPTMIQLATDGAQFSVYGIPCVAANYTKTVLPILLSVWAMSYIERFFRKYVPDTLSTVFAPFLTMVVAVPVSLCALAPVGSWAGNALAAGFEFLGTSGGIAAILGGGILAGLWCPMIITGMHVAVAMIAIANYMTVGTDSFVLVATGVSFGRPSAARWRPGSSCAIKTRRAWHSAIWSQTLSEASASLSSTA